MAKPPAAVPAEQKILLDAPRSALDRRIGNPSRWVRAGSIVFLALVVSLLVLPALETAHPFFRHLVPPLEERRKPAAFPSLRLLQQADGDFAGGLNAWFDDHFGFRDLFIRMKNQIDYSLFDTSRKVYIGKGGWLFYRGDPDGLRSLDAEKMSALEANFVTFARILADRDIRLIVVGYPDKSRIYPEMTPPGFPLVAEGGNYDKLRQFLSSRSDLTFIDAEEIIKHEKTITGDRLYSKTDPHATEIGQLPVVKEIVRLIAALEGRSEIRWNEDFKVGHAVTAGADARFAAPLIPIQETDFPYIIGRYTVGGEEPDGTWTLAIPNPMSTADVGLNRAFDFAFHSRPDLCPQRLPGMVIFGNSFSDLYWSLGLHRYFCFIRRARDPMSRFKLFYDTIPEHTKYFIFEYYSPWLPGDSPPVADIQ